MGKKYEKQQTANKLRNYRLENAINYSFKF